MTVPAISIIMRCKNSDWVIGSALAALYSQTFKDFELIVVDSGSTDTTLNIVKQYPCRLVEIEPSDYYPGQVLNDAIELASSELIVFLNSDSVMLSPYSLHNLVHCFDDPNTAAAFGRQAPRPEAHTWVKKDYDLSFPTKGKAPEWLTLSLPLAGFRKSIWRQHPFYTDAWASEDTEWGHWARENGHQVVYEPTALTMHSHNYTLKEIYGRRYVEGEADAFIYQQHTSLFRATLNYCKSVLSDALYHLKANDFAGLTFSPIRRFVYHWAHWQGNKLGTQRRNSGSTNASIGQQVVLKSQ